MVNLVLRREMSGVYSQEKCMTFHGSKKSIRLATGDLYDEHCAVFD